MTRRWFPLWLFLLTLLWGQASAYAHSLSHLKESDSAKHAHVCELCVAQANLGSAAPSATFALHLPTATYDWFVADDCPDPFLRLTAPRARAPPAFL